MSDPNPIYGFDRRGNAIDEAYIEQAVREVEEGVEPSRLRPIGRPSLTGEARHSPKVSSRVPNELLERAEAEAQRRGCTVSQLVREALEQYLAS